MKNRIFIVSIICLSNLVPVISQEYSWDTITFEEDFEWIVIDESENNLWVFDSPQKSSFVSAYEGEKVIITDAQSSYPTNNHSYFDLYLTQNNIQNYPLIGLDFYYMIHTPAGKDGGYIEVSHDKGQSWTNIIDDHSTCINPGDIFDGNEGLYSSNLFNGEPGFSGTTDEWTRVKVNWLPCLTKAVYTDDTTIVRFNFISDEVSESMDGWMIDNIRLFSGSPPGVVEERVYDLVDIIPNPASSEFDVKYPSELNPRKVYIYDLQGRKTGEYDKPNNIDISDLQDGYYIVEIVFKSKNVTRRLLVK